MAGVIVVGMHRSGTSAMARVVNMLGVPLGDPDDLLGPKPHNPTGHWESRILAAFNNEVLAALGGSWSVPPAIRPQWHTEARFERLRARAAQVFGAVYNSPDWIWKDPRTCITLPFWMDALGIRPVVVLVVRNPLEIADSLAGRERFPASLSLAIWERYVRHALLAINGLPVLAMEYAALLQAPASACSALREFLVRHELHLTDARPFSDIRAFLRDDLRHNVRTPEDLQGEDLSEQQRALYACLLHLRGEHGALISPQLPAETPATAELIAAHQEALRSGPRLSGSWYVGEVQTANRANTTAGRITI